MPASRSRVRGRSTASAGRPGCQRRGRHARRDAALLAHERDGERGGQRDGRRALHQRTPGRGLAVPGHGCGESKGPAARADPLERDHEGLIGGAGRLLQSDLAGPVAAQIRVVAAAGELGGLVGRRRGGELRMEHPPVPRHPAAGGPDRLDHPIGHRLGDLAEVPLEAHVPGGAGRVDGDGAEPLGDLEVREQPPRPGDRVEDLELAVPFPVLLVEPRWLAGEAMGAGTRVDHDRQLALPAPAPELGDGAVRHQGCTLGVALRRPRDRAAVAGDVVRDPDRHPGSRRDRHHRLRQREPGPVSARARRQARPV